jgi:hypothetical protein
MRKTLCVLLMCAAAVSAVCQATSSKYQPGTIMAVKPRQTAAGSDSTAARYDISLQVGNTLYVASYTPPPGTYGIQYLAGDQILVLVGSKTITFNDMLGNSRKATILSRKALPPKQAAN